MSTAVMAANAFIPPLASKTKQFRVQHPKSTHQKQQALIAGFAPPVDPRYLPGVSISLFLPSIISRDAAAAPPQAVA